jgi:Zn-dependent M28 family amino/carboxypeptidase
MMAGKPLKRTVRFVLFANEEPPYFQTDLMGSFVYAQGLREKDVNVVAMLSLETIGFYSDEPGSQQYPFPLSLLYPDTGNFIGFVSTTESRKLVRKALGIFRENTDFPSEGAAIPSMFPGADWSDHWAFMVHGYKGIMITDTAPYRYAHYHTSDDTPDKLDYRRMARVVTGIRDVVNALADE